jgi:hypothetical protein
MQLRQLSRRSSFDTGLVTRRDALVGLAASAWPALSVWAADDTRNVASLVRAGGCVVVLRHAATVPGVGDPPEFKLDDCRTQRNLSEAGQQDARRIGAWFRNSKASAASRRVDQRLVPLQRHGRSGLWQTHCLAGAELDIQ